MVNELVGAILEKKQAGNERCDVEEEDVRIRHAHGGQVYIRDGFRMMMAVFCENKEKCRSGLGKSCSHCSLSGNPAVSGNFTPTTSKVARDLHGCAESHDGCGTGPRSSQWKTLRRTVDINCGMSHDREPNHRLRIAARTAPISNPTNL